MESTNHPQWQQFMSQVNENSEIEVKWAGERHPQKMRVWVINYNTQEVFVRFSDGFDDLEGWLTPNTCPIEKIQILSSGLKLISGDKDEPTSIKKLRSNMKAFDQRQKHIANQRSRENQRNIP